MEEKSLNPTVTFMLTKKGKFYDTVCSICKVSVNSYELLDHLATKHFNALDHSSMDLEKYLNSSSKLHISVYFDEKTLHTILKVRSRSYDVLEILSVCISRKDKSTNVFVKNVQLLKNITVELPFNRMILDDSNETYKIMISFRNKTTLKEYLEIHSLEIEDSMISLMNYKRKVMKRALQPKANPLPAHESDRELLEYLDENFQLKNVSFFVQNKKIRMLKSYIEDDCRFTAG